MDNKLTDILIVGAGIVGLSLAYQIKKKFPTLTIVILEKEKDIGLHTSGRNSGVLHAGIYYKPGSIKSKVCVKGANRLKEWCKKERINLLKCGKVISPTSERDDSLLNLLKDRGNKNGAKVEMIDNKEIQKLIPGAFSYSGRALWSPNTYVVNPKDVLKKLYENLINLNVIFVFNKKIIKINIPSKEIVLSDSSKIFFGHFFNAAGLNSVEIAKKFNFAKDYILLPFKGLYFELNEKAPFKINRNLYPVPDLELPFLGVHFTPTLKGKTILGPTAIPSLGKENYNGFKNIELIKSIRFGNILVKQFFKNNSGFRKYALNQANLGLKINFWKSAKKLYPKLEKNHLMRSQKIGIRPQLYDTKKNLLIDDFVLDSDQNSTHVINAISPAFTASFELADLILEKSTFLNSL